MQDSHLSVQQYDPMSGNRIYKNKSTVNIKAYIITPLDK
jgi:hypothetical protein